MANGRRPWLFPALFGLVGVAIGVTLGTWQLNRLEWKAGLIAEAEARLKAAPVAIPDEVDPTRDKLLRVEAVGYIERREIHILTSMRAYGPGFRVIAPMELARGGVRTGRDPGTRGHRESRRSVVDALNERGPAVTLSRRRDRQTPLRFR